MHASNTTTFLSIFSLVISAAVPCVKLILFPKSYGWWEKQHEGTARVSVSLEVLLRVAHCSRKRHLTPAITSSIHPPLVWGQEEEEQCNRRKPPWRSKALLGWLSVSQEKRASDSTSAAVYSFPGLMLPEGKGLHWWERGDLLSPCRGLTAVDSPGWNR